MGLAGLGLLMVIAVERQRDILLSSENYPQRNGSASFFYQEAWSDHSTLNSNLEKVYNCDFLSFLSCERPRGVENCTESIENLDPWTLLRDYSMILSAVVADSAAIPFPSPDSSSLRQLAERETTDGSWRCDFFLDFFLWVLRYSPTFPNSY